MFLLQRGNHLHRHVQPPRHFLQRQASRLARLAKLLPAAHRPLKSVHTRIIAHNASALGIRGCAGRKFLTQPLLVSADGTAVAQPFFNLNGKL